MLEIRPFDPTQAPTSRFAPFSGRPMIDYSLTTQKAHISALDAAHDRRIADMLRPRPAPTVTRAVPVWYENRQHLAARRAGRGIIAGEHERRYEMQRREQRRVIAALESALSSAEYQLELKKASVTRDQKAVAKRQAMVTRGEELIASGKTAPTTAATLETNRAKLADLTAKEKRTRAAVTEYKRKIRQLKHEIKAAHEVLERIGQRAKTY